MGRRKLPAHGKLIHVGVSMPPDTWELVQGIGRARKVSASAILREAITEYVERRFGPVAEPPQQVAV